MARHGSGWKSFGGTCMGFHSWQKIGPQPTRTDSYENLECGVIGCHKKKMRIVKPLAYFFGAWWFRDANEVDSTPSWIRDWKR